RLGDLRPDVTPALDRLVARMLAKQPGDRPTDGTELALELLAIDPGEGGRPGPSSPGLPAITATERSVMCVVLARLPPAPPPPRGEGDSETPLPRSAEP